MYNNNHYPYYQPGLMLIDENHASYSCSSTPDTIMQDFLNTPDSEPEMTGPETQDVAENVVSVSTSFTPGSDPASDAILGASDNVFFYICQKTIYDIAPNAFRAYPALILSHPSVIMLDAPSPELNVIVHALYKSSPAVNMPPFETIIRAIDRMPAYGISPELVITPQTPLYDLLLSHAALYPLETYALAAHHGLSRLACTVSSHLLSHNLMTMSDEMAKRIGPVYLKRLMLLHASRLQALKDILLRPPIPHEETSLCTFLDQRKVTHTWALVLADLVWKAKPDTSPHTLFTSLKTILENLPCNLCKEAMQQKIKNVMVQWTSVKRTI